MSRFNHSEGLYRKTESPVVESVKQTEGLYQRTKTATVVKENLSEDDIAKVKEIEGEKSPQKKILVS